MSLRLIAFMALLLVLVPAAAHAALPGGNVIQNGDAEAGPAATSEADAGSPAGWDRFPNFTAVVYGTGAFPTAAESARIGGGRSFFAGGPDNTFSDFSVGQQLIDLAAAAPEIDGGRVRATLSGDIGGFAGQEDNATVTAVFTDGGSGSSGSVLQLLPANAAERGGQTTFVRRMACGTLPVGIRSAFVQISMQRFSGSYNDGYADNLSLTLSQTPCPAAPDPPLPPAEPPQPGVSANAEAVRGRILVKRPGGSDFQELGKDARSIPIGSEVDASRGTVLLETAADRRGKTQKARFYDSSFVMTQTRGSRPVTDLTLTGRLGSCRAGRDQVGTAARRSRRLWGNGTGRFRTRGRYASATVRGTLWSMTDTCASTTVRAARGTVVVRDLSKRKNITLKAPRTYTARAPRR